MQEQKKAASPAPSSTRCYLPYLVSIRALDGLDPEAWLPWCDFESIEDARFAVMNEKEQDAKFPPQRYRYKIDRIDGSDLLSRETMTKPNNNAATSVQSVVMTHSQTSQTEFEVARDIVTLVKSLKYGETVSIEITRGSGYCDWRCSGDNQPCGPGEAARAMHEAYDATFSGSPRDRSASKWWHCQRCGENFSGQNPCMCDAPIPVELSS